MCNKLLVRKQIDAHAKFCSRKCGTNYANSIRKYGYDTDLATKTDEEWFLYFLGLWVTDGHMSQSKQLTIGLTDKQIIYDVAKRINYTNKIGVRHSAQPAHKDKHEMALTGPLATKLIDLGYFPGKKSHRTFVPVSLNDTTFSHFLRGVVDGDGCMHISKPRGYLICSISSISKKFLMQIWDRLLWIGVVTGGTIKHDKSGLCRALKFSHYDSLRIGQYMYKNATLKLDRKFNNYQACLQKTLSGGFPKWRSLELPQ